jgi:ATP synthase protein I
MLAHFASMARRSATVTAAAAVLMVVISAVLGGTRGLLAAVIATVVVALFFGVSMLAVGKAAKVGPQAMMLAAIGSYLFKMLVLVILFGEFQNSTAFSPVLFGLTALVLVLAYDGSLIVWWSRTKMLYVEPDGER